MKKRIGSLLFSLMLCLSLLPAAAQAAGAHSNHCICGQTHTEVGDHTAGSSISNWQVWSTADALPTTAGNYYLTQDVTLSATWNPVDGTALCLNGHTITGADGEDVIKVESGNTFTLTDCAETPGKVIHNSGKVGRGVTVGGTFKLYGGSITQNKKLQNGGGINTSGTFTMYGGSITGNENTAVQQGGGGGVYVSAGTFTLYGGSISGNSLTNEGAGTGGGGVYVSGGTFDMKGGEISSNTVKTNGSGVYITGGTFNMSAGTISSNKATPTSTSINNGRGGVYINDGALTMTGGAIRNNEAKNIGGGVCMINGTFTVSGSVRITDNQKGISEKYTENVYLNTNQKITIGGTLDSSAQIGVKLASDYSEDGYFTDGWATYMSTTSNSCFTCDDTSKSIMMENGQPKIVGHVHEWTYKLDGKQTIKVTCGNTNGCTGSDGGSIKINAPSDPSPMDYDGTEKKSTLKNNNLASGVSVPTIRYTKDGAEFNGTPKDVGAYTASITLGNVTATVSYQISPKTVTVSDANITIESGSFIYTGNPITPTVQTVKDGGDTIAPSEYAVEYSDNTNAGTATITIRDREGGNYTVNGSKTFTISKATPNVTVNAIEATYSGSPLAADAITGNDGGLGGTWSWKDGNAPKTVADSTSASKTWTAVFTPNDTTNYKTVDCTVAVTINPKPLTITGVNAANRDYAVGNTTVNLTGGTLEGTAVGDNVGVTLGQGTISDANAGVDKPVSTSITLTGTDMGNYTLTQPTGIRVTINKIDPSYTIPTGLTATYGQTLANVSLPSGWSWKDVTSTPVGDAGDRSFDAVFTPSDLTNYNIVTKPVTITVGKATYSGSTTIKESAKYGATRTVDLSRLVMPGGTVAITGTSDTNSVLSTYSIDSSTNLLTFTLQNDATKVGQTADINISVSGCTNYDTYSLTVCVTVSDKIAPTVTAPTVVTGLTYNGTAQALITAGSTNGGTLQYSLDNSTWSTALPIGTDAKIYTVYYKVVGDNTYADVAENHFTVTIAAAELTIRAEDKNAVVGAAMPTLTYTVSGLLPGEALTTEPTLNCTATDTNTAGTYPITISGANAGTNYTIHYTNGTLTVSEKQTPAVTLTPSRSSLSGGGTVTLTVGGLPSGAICTVTCDDAAYNPVGSGSSWSVTLPNTTATYTFTVNFAGNDSYNSANADCTVSVTQYTAPSFSYTPPVSKPTATVPVTSGKGSVEVKAELSDGTANVTVSDRQIDQIISNGADSITVDLSALEDIDRVKLPSKMVEKTNAVDDAALTVALPTGTVALDETVLASVSTGEDVTVSVQEIPIKDLTETQQKAVEDRASIGLVVEVDLFVGNQKQSTFNGGKLTISIPYTPKEGEDTSKLTVWFVRDDGSIENKGGSYHAEKRCFTFETDHLSRYLLVNVTDMPWENPFTDVAEDAWYYEAICWAASNGITDGIDATHFAPDATCTRAQIVAFLWKLEGKPIVDAELNFADVAASAWHAEAIRWAAANDIVYGYNGNFNPEGEVTREQVVTILYRYAKSIGIDTTQGGMLVREFNDYEDISDYAIAAMQWAVNAGIMQGDGTNLMPTAECIRAQIVTMLYRLLGK